jgi:2-dehydro-3-deoxygluconokinase
MTANTPRIVALGECMIELRHQADGLARQAFGGDTLNTAIYLARLADTAYAVSFATALGADDPYSQAMLAQWEGERLDTGFVSRHAGALPGLYSIHVDDQGERRFHYWRDNSPARRYLSGAESPLESRVDEVGLLYFSGISLAILPEAGRARLFALVERLRARGARVVFDNNYRPRLWASVAEARRCYTQACASADIALLTLSDEQELFGLDDERSTQAHIAALPCPELVVKRGAAPTRVRLDRVWHEVPTLAVPRVVDTTAAGDSFGAGYLAARLHGRGPAEAASAGNALAATVIQHPGAIIPMAAMPRLFGGS